MNREDALKQQAAEFPVDTLAWGLVRVRELRGSDLPVVLEILESPPGPMRLARLAVLGCVEPRFQPGDEGVLMEGPLEPLNVIAAAVLERAGLGEGEKKSSPPSSTLDTGLRTSSATPTPIGSWPPYPLKHE